MGPSGAAASAGARDSGERGGAGAAGEQGKGNAGEIRERVGTARGAESVPRCGESYQGDIVNWNGVGRRRSGDEPAAKLSDVLE